MAANPLRALIALWLQRLAAGHLGIRWSFAAALIPGMLAGSVLFYTIYDSKQEQLEESALQTARALIQASDGELAKAKAAAETLSKSEHLATNNYAAFHAQASDILRTTGVGSNFVLSDANGQQIVNTLRPYPDTLPRHGNPALLRQVFQSRQAVISNLYFGPVLHQPVVSIDVPVFQNGKVVYDLSVGVFPERLNRLLAAQKLPPGWIAAVLDSQNTVVARSHNPATSVGQKATPDLIAHIEQSSEGRMSSHTLEGVPSFVAFSRSRSTGWSVSLGMTRDVLYADLYGPAALAGVTFAAFLLGGAILVSVFAKRVRTALQTLEAATEAATRGDLEAVAPPAGPQEVARLAEQFNRMQRARKESEAQLHLAASVFSAAHDGIIITDRDARIIDVNQAFTHITGYTHDEVIGKQTRFLHSDRHDRAFYEAMRQAVTQTEHWQGEVWVRRKDETLFAARMTISTIKGPNGAIDHYLGVFSDITRTLQQQEEIERLAYYDPLTQLPNRRLLTDRLQQALSFAARQKTQVAVCYLDLDGFKEINDTHGHAAGDQLLLDVSHRLTDSVRAHDTVSRLGGDEFVLLLTELNSRDEGDAILSRVLHAMDAAFTVNHHHTARVSASMGVACYPQDGTEPDVLLRCSDQAMYQAKHAGRNRIVRFRAAEGSADASAA